jgi:hypothetical protein
MKEITVREIEKRIFSIRGSQVMIDRDLAEFYKVETKVFNQTAKKNLELVTNCDRFAKEVLE